MGCFVHVCSHRDSTHFVDENLELTRQNARLVDEIKNLSRQQQTEIDRLNEVVRVQSQSISRFKDDVLSIRVQPNCQKSPLKETRKVAKDSCRRFTPSRTCNVELNSPSFSKQSRLEKYLENNQLDLQRVDTEALLEEAVALSKLLRYKNEREFEAFEDDNRETCFEPHFC